LNKNRHFEQKSTILNKNQRFSLKINIGLYTYANVLVIKEPI